MNARQRARYEVRARIVKALAHPSRLFIVDELARGERCVCELTEMVGADVSTVSKHLSVLKNAGLVGSRREGQQVFYFLLDGALASLCLGFFGKFSCCTTLFRDSTGDHDTRKED